VVNAATLSPTAAFLVVIGLRFIPLFVLVLLYWVIFGYHADAGFLAHPAWERGYMHLGILFLAIEFIFLAASSGDDSVWKAGVPGRWTLLIGSAVVLGANLAVWFAGRRYFRNLSISSYKPLLRFCATAYLVVAVAAVFIDHEHNLFNRYYLDKRWPEAYISRNPEAITDLDALLGPKLKSEVGPDLANLLKDPEFQQALRGGVFYRQCSDDTFGVCHPVIMFAYKRPSPANSSPARFVEIRFPRKLAEALRFEPIAGEKQTRQSASLAVDR
jgi:hypothetical protein